MKRRKKNKLKRQFLFYATVFFGASLAFLIWKLWKLLDNSLGNGIWVYVILGVIVLIGILTGQYGWKKIMEKIAH